MPYIPQPASVKLPPKSKERNAMEHVTQTELYGRELDAAAEILRRVHPVGAIKAIGRREVAAALADLFPLDVPALCDLSDEDIATVLDRYDDSAPAMQRRITAGLICQLSKALSECESLRRQLVNEQVYSEMGK